MKKPFIVLAAIIVAGVPACGAGGKSDAKRKPPATPFTIFVFAAPEDAMRQDPSRELETAEKDLVDSANDIRKYIRKKRADWFTLIEDREGAEIVLEVTERYGEMDRNKRRPTGEMYVKGNVKILDYYDGPISFTFDIEGDPLVLWRQVAGRLIDNLRDTCAESLDELEKRRDYFKGVRAGVYADLSSELDHLTRVENSVVTALNSLMDRARREAITTQALVDGMNRDVLAPWQKVRERFTGLSVHESQKEFHGKLLTYIRLQDEGWTLLTEAFEENDTAKADAAKAKQAEADRVIQELMKR